MTDADEADADPVLTWTTVEERAFRSWRPSDRGRGLRCVVRRETGSDRLGRRVTATRGDETLLSIRTWRDQWGTWIWGESPGEWEVAQEDGTPSFLAALIDALVWLREDDFGTPMLAKPAPAGFDAEEAVAALRTFREGDEAEQKRTLAFLEAADDDAGFWGHGPSPTLARYYLHPETFSPDEKRALEIEFFGCVQDDDDPAPETGKAVGDAGS